MARQSLHSSERIRTENENKAPLLTVYIFITGSGASSQNNLNMSQHNRHSDHPLQNAWLLNAAIGVAGVVLNCIVLNLSIKEWKIVSSINAMIMYVKV